MSTVLEVSPRRQTLEPAVRFAATRALAGIEGRRLLRSPIVAGAAILSAAVFVLVTRNQLPVLQRDLPYTSLALLPLAAGALIATNLAATRSNRERTGELFRSTVLGEHDRTGARLLSTLWVTALALVWVALGIGYLLLRGEIGHADIAEALTGPAIVAGAAASGILLGRWWPSPVAAPILAVSLGAFQLYLSAEIPDNLEPPRTIRWLALWAAPSLSGNPTPELLWRPSGWHLLYIVAIAVALSALALLRGGFRLAWTGMAIGCVVLALLAGSVQLRGPSAQERRGFVKFATDPGSLQTCQRRGIVDYCAYPSYLPWVDRWSAIISPVIRRAPSERLPAEIRIRQFPITVGSDLPYGVQYRLANRWQFAGRDKAAAFFPGTQIYTSTNWAAGAEGRDQRFALALGTAAWIVGLPPTARSLYPVRQHPNRVARLAPAKDRTAITRLIHTGTFDACSSAGQARSIVALWLAAQASPDVAEMVRAGGAGTSLQDFDSVAVLFATGDPIRWGVAETRYAVQLLNQDSKQVAAELRQHWQLLTRPATTTDQAVRVLDLDPLAPTAATPYARLGIIPCP